MGKKFNAKLICENGREFYGFYFGAEKEVVCPLAVSTAMVGYQEAISDPTSASLGVVITYPIIGNYGITDEDNETKNPTLAALIVREYNDMPSNFRCTRTLSEWLEENGIVGISGLDTRALARMLREEGAMRGIITTPETTSEEGVKKIKETPLPTDLVKKVSSKKMWYVRTADHKFNVVAIDCGIKQNIIKMLGKRACNVTVVPYNTSAEEILSLKPDGVLVSNGPGNPEDIPEVIKTVSDLKEKVALLGIGLGHQIIALASGGKVYKMKNAHCGGNHPVRNLETGKIEITAQNHSFAVCEESLKGTGLKVTHKNVLDGTVEGMKSESAKTISVQHHPESAPGPQDSEYIFDIFAEMMEKGGKE